MFRLTVDTIHLLSESNKGKILLSGLKQTNLSDY